ncbi:hypothetical protein AJ81_06440 [Pseudothermotoga hypogea DSM 11164 = NBRC 106472]|uniref:Uncharacterized protein n=1 Tax=Pseudothermotoga hypogea DSM 11164 = NBRC 106472 TaxID=1123384 RepID=A0A0X1KU65_9THEM|nr:hypothetical protein [Pseudothermotoga hypogea]AJC74791.1 hypothetical protein AJ81_06440 [Pseudothermotoga hypogea DSM 11164 = NBRC 106472]
MAKWIACLVVFLGFTAFGQSHLFFCTSFVQEDYGFATLEAQEGVTERAVLPIEYDSGGFVHWHAVLTVFENRVASLTREMPEGPRTVYLKVEESDLALILNYVCSMAQQQIGEPEVNSDLYRIKCLEKEDAELIIYVSPRYYETKDHPVAQLIEVLRKWLRSDEH